MISTATKGIEFHVRFHQIVASSGGAQKSLNAVGLDRRPMKNDWLHAFSGAEPVRG